MIVGVIFWGCTLLSVAMSVAALVRRSPALLVAAAVLAAPVSLYFGGTPRFRYFGFFLPVLPLLAALIVRRRRLPAAILVGIFIAPPVWLLVAAVASNVGGAA